MRKLVDPMCEIFPKQAGCYYARYGLGGGMDSRHGMCVLGLNMINDKVFFVLWLWEYFLVTVGCLRIVNRGFQVSSSKVRFFLIKVNVYKYFKKNAHMKHINRYIHRCSIGDWFVLYQMSKNLNSRFFAEFLALLAMTVDPDPSMAEEPEIHLTPEDIEKIRFAASSASNGSDRRNGASSSSSSDEEDGRRRRGNFLSRLDAELDDGGGDGGDGGGGLSGKQRNLIKLGKHAKSANKKAMMAAAAMRRKR